jgi:hypothetical protein
MARATAKAAAWYQGTLSRLRLTKAKPAWIELEWVEERSDATSSWYAVSLGFNGESVTALSPSLPKDRVRHGVHRAALATLKAIELFVHHQFSCELLDVELVRALGATLIMVRVRLDLDGESVELFGSARVVDDFTSAAANAALDATNLYIDYALSHQD